ncbi:hypothetical protein EV356DRAFT_374176 [Viridothelium virens]|uniref:Vesicle tethering protein Uso1/P115-like head domain-containing protein n=1 Tax=Viridothelium virens TaxID=1048519 RepID=A0A6A6GWK8_VIRVR|nr:hypothetical protein EV356DRAFT_374176 [Viridothelium virens]
MLRMLEAQAPAKQTATDTINTLSGRLNNANLLEDRRAAILGLRSFAKEYPASVASGALRGLISSLTKDGEDVDTTKVILETLLMLFSPNERSPEASDDIALWLADEFTQRQDNITMLLDLLETPDFYSRLYSLQLITAICSARPDRTQECILSAPLGTTRLVALLDDPRDAVRNAGLLLCTDLTQSSTELQKLVAFENAFDRVFRLIEAEGSLLHGGIIVQDCLSLLANLIRGNTSNQSLFRESGCVKRVLEVLPGGSRDGTLRDGDGEDNDFENPQKGKNIWGLLAIIRMFFIQGSVSSRPNSETFQKHGFLQRALDLAFSSRWEGPIRAEALHTCADMIRGNTKLQEGFAQLQVNPFTQPTAPENGRPQTNGISKVYVIDALLDLTLRPSAPELYSSRFAACECLKAYSHGHGPIRLHFLHRAIDGHTSGEDETANVLTTLIHGPPGSWSSNPYGSWFAAVLVLHLIFDDPEAKKLLINVTEGDAENGEEVVTCIQAITGNLIDCLQREQDQRISIGYLMLLCCWLFDSDEAVNDFLGEGSSLQILVQVASNTSDDEYTILRGLSAALLGIIYEFSTKDSPISRRTLHPILTSRLGRELYIDVLKQLRRHPLIRDFEISQQGTSSLAAHGSLPSVYFDPTFIDFLKDNFSRLIRAVDRDPGIEILPSSSSTSGINRDALDDLRAELSTRLSALQKAESDILSLESALNQAHAEHKRAQETSAAEVARIKNINDALHKGHDTEVQKIHQGHRASTEYLQDQHARELEALQSRLQRAESRVQDVEQEVQDQRDRAKADSERWRAAFSDAQVERDDAREELATARREIQGVLAERDRARGEAEEARKAGGEQARQLGRMTELEQERQRIAGELADAKLRIEELMTVAQEQEVGRGEVERRVEKGRQRVEELEAQLAERDRALTKANQKVREVDEEVGEREEARKAVQGELDEMLMVMTDLEEKRAKDKVCFLFRTLMTQWLKVDPETIKSAR